MLQTPRAQTQHLKNYPGRVSWAPGPLTPDLTFLYSSDPSLLVCFETGPLLPQPSECWVTVEDCVPTPPHLPVWFLASLPSALLSFAQEQRGPAAGQEEPHGGVEQSREGTVRFRRDCRTPWPTSLIYLVGLSPSCLPSLISPAVPAVCARRVPPAEGPPLQRLRSASSLSDCLQSLGLLATSPGPSPTRCSLPGPWQSHCVPQPPCAA